MSGDSVSSNLWMAWSLLVLLVAYILWINLIGPMVAKQKSVKAGQAALAHSADLGRLYFRRNNYGPRMSWSRPPITILSLNGQVAPIIRAADGSGWYVPLAPGQANAVHVKATQNLVVVRRTRWVTLNLTVAPYQFKAVSATTTDIVVNDMATQAVRPVQG